MITIALVALSDASRKYKLVIFVYFDFIMQYTLLLILCLLIIRDELYKIMDIMENKEWYDEDELDNILMESRYTITNAKTFYLVSRYQDYQ